MKIQITLDIPEESVYAGVVSDALEKIAPYWDEGARGGDLECDAGPVSWDSNVEDDAESCAGCGEFYVPGDDAYGELCATCADKGEMQGDRYVAFKEIEEP